MKSTTPLQPDLPGSFRDLSLVSGIRASSARGPDKIALRDRHGTRTYAQLIGRIDQVSYALHGGSELNPGDHCGILSLNCNEYIELVVGLSQVGVAAATINPRLSKSEITDICNDAGARVLFVDAANIKMAKSCDFASVVQIIEFGTQYEDWLAGANLNQRIPSVAECLPFTIPYTSGTTGRPKGVLISSRSRVLTFFSMGIEYGCFSSRDRFLAIAPLCHGAGMAFALASVYFGGYTHLVDSFDPEDILRELSIDEISGVFMVPAHFHAIFALEPKLLAALQSFELRTIISNAAPLPQATKKKIVEYFGEGLLHECYGSTEGGIITSLRPEDQLRKQKCVGHPFPATEVSIRNEEGVECIPNEVGELFCRSPCLFNGYWQLPEETAEALQLGWCTVGDLARRDEEGYIYIVDRKKDMVITGGMNVYPSEIEDVLIRHPNIIEIAVIGVADDHWGESLKAFVITKNGKPPDYDELVTFCEDSLAKFKIPRKFVQIDALPRNAGGKILRTVLRKIIDPAV